MSEPNPAERPECRAGRRSHALFLGQPARRQVQGFFGRAGANAGESPAAGPSKPRKRNRGKANLRQRRKGLKGERAAEDAHAVEQTEQALAGQDQVELEHAEQERRSRNKRRQEQMQQAELASKRLPVRPIGRRK